MSKTVLVKVMVGSMPFHRSAISAPGANVRHGVKGEVLEVVYNGDIRRRIRAGDLALVPATEENQTATTKAKE